jgi:hypothetical protein
MESAMVLELANAFRHMLVRTAVFVTVLITATVMDSATLSFLSRDVFVKKVTKVSRFVGFESYSFR